jgi:hypothetical protein
MKASDAAIDFGMNLVSFGHFFGGSCGGVLPGAGWDGWLGQLGWLLDARCWMQNWLAGWAGQAGQAGWARGASWAGQLAELKI